MKTGSLSATFGVLSLLKDIFKMNLDLPIEPLTGESISDAELILREGIDIAVPDELGPEAKIVEDKMTEVLKQDVETTLSNVAKVWEVRFQEAPPRELNKMVRYDVGLLKQAAAQLQLDKTDVTLAAYQKAAERMKNDILKFMKEIGEDRGVLETPAQAEDFGKLSRKASQIIQDDFARYVEKHHRNKTKSLASVLQLLPTLLLVSKIKMYCTV